MSPLTKLFVVLLVILSLLTTAATVVYVNKEDFNSETLKQTQAQLAAAQETARRAEDQARVAQENATAIQQQANAQAAVANNALAQADSKVATLNVELAKAASQGAAQQLDVSRLTEALNASQQTSGRQQEEVVRLRTNTDQLVRQSSELNSSVSDLTNKLEVTERERRNLAEQLTQESADLDKANRALAAAGVRPEQMQPLVNRAGPAINGVIRDVRTIAGVQYATISIGSADGVQRGMEFKVLDRASGNFLGTLVVDTTDPNESTGRLAGPNVAAIRPGVEVRTQL